MGSDTVAVTLEKSGEGVSRSSSVLRRLPKQQRAITASITPANKPGKKPTKTASVGNLLYWTVGAGLWEELVAAVCDGELVDCVEEVELGSGVDGDFGVEEEAEGAILDVAKGELS